MGGTFKEMTGALFPGQGSEREGMLSLLKRRERWGQVLTFDITSRKVPSKICQPSYVKCQDLTPNLQGNIYAVSASLWEDIKTEYKFTLLAGHSLGFYSALYASGSVDFETGLYLINAAHSSIADATSKSSFGMTAIVGIKSDIIECFCRGFKDLYVANINSATQVVVSGSIESLEAFEKKVYSEGALKVIRLSIRYPLHTPLLEGTPELMREAIRDIMVRHPLIPIVDHTTGEILTTSEQLRETLIGQFTKKVIWRDVIKRMWQYGVRRFVEVGPGDVLSKITRWIERDAEVISLDVQV